MGTLHDTTTLLALLIDFPFALVLTSPTVYPSHMSTTTSSPMPVAAAAAAPPATMAGLQPVLEQDAAAPRDDGHRHATGPRTAAAPGATDATAATDAGATDPGATGAAGAAP